MPDNIIWKCQNCESINKENTCIVCGEKRPTEVDSNNNSQQRPRNSGKIEVNDEVPPIVPATLTKKHTGVIIVVILMLMVLISAVVIFLFFYNPGSEASQNNSGNLASAENVEIMNANAQFIYKSVLDYCVLCVSNGNDVSDGIYCTYLENVKSDYTYNGTFEDMRSYLNSTIGQESIQYYAVTIKNGIPDVAFWGTEPLDNIVESVTQYKIIEDNLIIGIYPPYNKAEGELKNTENAAEVTNIEQIDVEILEFDDKLFESKLLECINNARYSIGLQPIKEESKTSEISQKLITEISNKTYVKGTSKKYFDGVFEYGTFYYEEAFDVNNYANEEETAKKLLEYEKENFSSKWLDEKYQYFAADTFVNDDGTYVIVFCLAG